MPSLVIIVKKHLFFISLSLVFLLCLISLNIGPIDISIKEWPRVVLFSLKNSCLGSSFQEATQSLSIQQPKLFQYTHGCTYSQFLAFFYLRLPRLFMAIWIGIALGGAGSCMQMIFRNPLCDPALLGISSGATLGALLTMFFFKQAIHINTWQVPLGAFLGGISVSLAVYAYASNGKEIKTHKLLFSGVLINALCSSMIGCILFYANDGALRDYVFWTLGSLENMNWSMVYIVGISVWVPFMILIKFGPDMHALLLGQAEAKLLGVNTSRVIFISTVCIAFMVGSTVATCGIIGFIGLIVPNLIRLIVGIGRTNILFSAIIGSSIILCADSFSRLSWVGGLPIGVSVGIFSVVLMSILGLSSIFKPSKS